MFLTPFIISATNDILAIYFYLDFQSVLASYLGSTLTYTSYDDENDNYYNEIENNEAIIDDDIDGTIIQSKYIPVFTAIRLLCLIPYTIHMATGERIKVSFLYRLFHCICLGVVGIHLIKVYTSHSSELYGEADDDDHTDIYLCRELWLILWLSLISTICHFVMLHHVGSTGPDYVQMNYSEHVTKKNPRISAYAAAWRYTSHWEDSMATISNDEPFLKLKRLFENNSSRNFDEQELFSELQGRLATARKHWGKQLEEVTTKLPRGLQNFQSQTSFKHFVTPFRVLLHLYAYQDVLSNGELDAMWDMEKGGAIVTFYIPQLLTFLLHGAYLNAPQLEHWILEKCEESLYFAHKCFWFLRGWCLHSKLIMAGMSYADDDIGSEHNGWNTGRYPIKGVKDNMRRGRALSMGNLEQNTTITKQFSHSKFPMEEYRMIENLLVRVMERAEKAAYLLMYGQDKGEVPDVIINADESSTSSPYAVANATQLGLIPICPVSGRPSSNHLDTITATQKYGFLPLVTSPDTTKDYYSLESNFISRSNSSFYASSDDDFSKLFRTAPQFFDALLAIADDLMLVPRENRTVELRNRLQRLEFELLPSNVIYIPVSDVYHRVWRITSSESIALSTKERVPCFVSLEVVNFDLDSSKPRRRDDEREVLDRWYRRSRPPQRHNNFLEKVFQNTQKGFKKFQGDMSNHMKTISRNQNYCAPNCNQSINTNSSHGLIPSNTSMETPSTPPGKVTCFELSSNVKMPSYYNPSVQPSTDIEVSRPASPPPTAANAMGQWKSPPKPIKRITSKNEPPFYTFPTFPFSPSNENSDKKASLINKTNPISPTYETLPHSASSSSSSISSHHITSTITPPTVVFKENWTTKSNRIKQNSAFGTHAGWRLLPILIKSNDDLRQEQLASQLITRMAAILARANIPVWLYPYQILALTHRGGVIEAIPDTISIDSLKRNDPHFTSLKDFFDRHFAPINSDKHADAKANFVESLAAYSIVTYLLQIKDRHNGNILLDNKGHIIHIDFGFLFLSSPGQNSGFEKAPFKLTSDFVTLMDGPESRTFQRFRDLCARTFIELRKHCYQLILMVEMITEGNDDLSCFCNRPKEAIEELRNRFRLDLSDSACVEFVNGLIDESLENWRTRWYDRYQRFCVGVL